MPAARLSSTDRDDVQRLLENLQQASPSDQQNFIGTFARGNDAAWHRFLKGAYNHPITWWIGIFQLAMQTGMLGHKHRSNASARASLLWQVTEPLRREIESGLAGEGTPILSSVVRYNLRHRKADIVGRLVGGTFTNYASTGGRFGNRRLSGNAKRVRTITNFGLASYGAAIKAMAKGNKTVESVLQSILTGRPEDLPKGFRAGFEGAITEEERKITERAEEALGQVMQLSQLSPGPVPIEEFCSRPENVDLESICQ